MNHPDASDRPVAWLGWPAAMTLLVLPLTSPVLGDEPIRFANQHVDIVAQLESSPSLFLKLALHDEDRGVEAAATNAILIVDASARILLPAGFDLFGAEGDSLWVLPQVQNPDLLHLGLSAEEIPAATFSDTLELRLTAVEGPGHFFAWQANAPGDLTVKFNSRDGISPDDVTALVGGSHQHLNLGFSSGGVFRVTLQASGQLSGEDTIVFSEPTTFIFQVLPLPAPSSSFARWQETHWRDETNPLIIGPSADPDSDHQLNLLEYASGTDPTAINGHPPRLLRVISPQHGTDPRAHVVFHGSNAAEDLDFLLWTADDIAGEWIALHSDPVSRPVEGAGVEVRWMDPRPMDSRTAAFYRLEVRLRDDL
jgi:surface-anchored protein